MKCSIFLPQQAASFVLCAGTLALASPVAAADDIQVAQKTSDAPVAPKTAPPPGPKDTPPTRPDQTPAGQTKARPVAPTIDRYQASAGGARWTLNVYGAEVVGGQSQVGGRFIRFKDRVRLEAGVDALALKLSSGEIVQYTQVGVVGRGSAYRETFAVLPSVGVGVQARSGRLRPFAVGRVGLALGQDNIGLELDIDASTTDTAIGTFYGYSLENHLALQQPLLSHAVGLKAGIIPFFWGRNAVELGVDVMKWTNTATYSVGVYAAFSIDALPKDKKHTPAKGK